MKSKREMMNTPPEYDKKKNSQRLRDGLRGHVEMVAGRGRAKYPSMEKLDELMQLIGDPEIVRFPTTIVFTGDDSTPDEAVKVERDHDALDESYIITLDKNFREREADAVMLALYVIVNINYGKIAKKEEAEDFASILLGIPREDYSRKVEALKNELQ
ncbi:MAG: hypothetical protein IMF07_06975 [Proteobacteria bacterium]|nr:hypothetical protein [Pseudomonadota bacterium]